MYVTLSINKHLLWRTLLSNATSTQPKSKGLCNWHKSLLHLYMSHPPNISAGNCYSPSLMTSTISPMILHNVPFPQVLGQQLGPSPFSREFPAWKVNQAATLRGSTLPAIPSGFHGSWSLAERWKATVLMFQSPRRVLLSPLLTTVSSKIQLLNRTCSESLHIGLGTLISETLPSSYSFLKCSILWGKTQVCSLSLGTRSFPFAREPLLTVKKMTQNSLLAYLDLGLYLQISSICPSSKTLQHIWELGSGKTLSFPILPFKAISKNAWDPIIL